MTFATTDCATTNKKLERLFGAKKPAADISHFKTVARLEKQYQRYLDWFRWHKSVK